MSKPGSSHQKITCFSHAARRQDNELPAVHLHGGMRLSASVSVSGPICDVCENKRRHLEFPSPPTGAPLNVLDCPECPHTLHLLTTLEDAKTEELETDVTSWMEFTKLIPSSYATGGSSGGCHHCLYPKQPIGPAVVLMDL